MPGAAVATWQNGLAVYWRNCSRDDALRELDVSEDALEPITP
jgi:hypothetical protein